MSAITIDGFEFEGLYSDVSDIENLNYYLEKRFNRYDIKDYISRLHPELFPGHIGLQSDRDLRLSVVLWRKGSLDPWGEYDRGWSCSKVDNPEKYLNDILAFCKENDTPLYNFIKDKING